MEKKEFIVIGMGRFGKSIAKTLSQNNCEVLIVDKEEDKIHPLAEEVTCAICGDSTDREMMEGLGIKNFDGAVVAIAGDLEASIVTTMILKELGVKHVLAKAMTDLHAKVLRKVGADMVVFPEKEMGIRYANNLIRGNFFDAIELSPNYSMVEIPVKKQWENKSLKELNLRAKYRINVIGIKKEDVLDVSPDADEPLLSSYVLIAIGPNDKIDKIVGGAV